MYSNRWQKIRKNQTQFFFLINPEDISGSGDKWLCNYSGLNIAGETEQTENNLIRCHVVHHGSHMKSLGPAVRSQRLTASALARPIITTSGLLIIQHTRHWASSRHFLSSRPVSLGSFTFSFWPLLQNIRWSSLRLYKWLSCRCNLSYVAYLLYKAWTDRGPAYCIYTTWSWVLLEKTPIAQLLKNFTFYGTRRFIAVFTRALHWSLSWARSIQSIPPHPISLRSILILSSHLRL
jgi:hypothetical protein